MILNKIPPESVGGFGKIGINNIVDRIWFVDGPFEGSDMGYGTPSGADFGIAVAEGESRRVLEELFELARANAAQYVTYVADELEENAIHQLFDKLRGNGIDPTALVASLDQSTRFWFFKSFIGTHETRRGLISPEGNFHGVPIFHSRLLPDGVILFVDRMGLGTLEVKADFDIWVSDIREEERESIRKALPELESADLDEKVRILRHDIIKATIHPRKPCATFHLVAKKETDLKLKMFS
jgi:hypothetical protein